MHHHHIDMFSGSESGVRFAEYGIQTAGTEGGGATRPAPTNTGGKSRPSTPTKQRPAKTAPSKPAPSGPTAIEQAKEAIKDGKISTNERSTVEKAPVRDAIKGERTRLQESLKKAEGASEHMRDGGRLVLDDDGKPAENGLGTRADTEHEERVQDLTRDKDKKSLDALDEQIESLEEAGVTTGLDALKDDRAERAEQEAEVAKVIEERESLIGALEVEKSELENDAPAAAENDYQELREDAQKWIDQFNENGGQSFTSNGVWVTDDWDDEDGDITFDKLMEDDLTSDEQIDEFARVQGRNDGDGGDDEASMEEHIADVAGDDPAEAARIAKRYQAAQELQEIARAYNEAKDASTDNSEQIAQLEAEIGILEAANEEDRAALSTETLEAIDEGNLADTDVIAAPEMPSKSAPSTPSEGNGNGGDNGGGGNGNGQGGAEGTGNGQGAGNGNGNGSDGADGTGNGNGQGGPEGTEGNGNGQGGPEGTEGAGGTREVQIDYSTPERREQVLTQAREQNLVPAQNTQFNEQGQAVYTVQPNDSYWRISDMSDGKPPHEFDRQHFANTLSLNSERFGRDPQVGLIHPNEQVVIPGRSVEELVALMGLPTTEQVPVEEEPAPRRPGPQVQ